MEKNLKWFMQIELLYSEVSLEGNVSKLASSVVTRLFDYCGPYQMFVPKICAVTCIASCQNFSSQKMHGNIVRTISNFFQLWSYSGHSAIPVNTKCVDFFLDIKLQSIKARKQVDFLYFNSTGPDAMYH